MTSISYQNYIAGRSSRQTFGIFTVTALAMGGFTTSSMDTALFSDIQYGVQHIQI